jgi:Flp pilus assembly protein CpaB
MLLARRALAVALFLAAGVLAVQPPTTASPPGSLTLVSAHDITAGSVLKASDVQVVSVPDKVRAVGALATPEAAVGRVLAGAARAGEPITDARLVDLSPGIPATGDPGRSIVPVRLADPAVGALLRPGSRVDVVAGDEGNRAVLASLATVAAVTADDVEPRDGPGGTAKGRLVLLDLPSDAAARLAGVSLGGPVAVTLR